MIARIGGAGLSDSRHGEKAGDQIEARIGAPVP